MNRIARKRCSVVVVNNNKILGFNAEDPIDGKKYFFIPGGKPEKNETWEQTAIRETFEETGYKIRIDSNKSFIRKYDFYWNGDIYDCETWYFIGFLESLESKVVCDASYHQGVSWVPLSDIDKTFDYHSDIRYSVKTLVGEISNILRS